MNEDLGRLLLIIAAVAWLSDRNSAMPTSKPAAKGRPDTHTYSVDKGLNKHSGDQPVGDSPFTGPDATVVELHTKTPYVRVEAPTAEDARKTVIAAHKDGAKVLAPSHDPGDSHVSYCEQMVECLE